MSAESMSEFAELKENVARYVFVNCLDDPKILFGTVL